MGEWSSLSWAASDGEEAEVAKPRLVGEDWDRLVVATVVVAAAVVVVMVAAGW